MSEDFDPTTRYWDPTTIRLDKLLARVKGQEIALPQFQRDFKWGPKDFIPFLHSVLNFKITGSLLILDIGNSSQHFAPRSLERGPVLDLSKLESLLLDGQQRTTTLYHAFVTGFQFRRKYYRPYINVLELLHAESLLEEHIHIDIETGRTIGEQASDSHLELQVLLDFRDRMSWLEEFAQTEKAQEEGWTTSEIHREIEKRFRCFDNIVSYEFPATNLRRGCPPSLIVDIFQDINRRGRRLDVFELMVARCFNEKEPSGNDPYNLRTHWEEAFKQTTYLEKIGITDANGLLPLNLIGAALIRERKVNSKGLDGDTILSMDPSFITGTQIDGAECSLETAVEALDRAAKLLYEQCGVLDGTLLPQDLMIIPIAEQYFLSRAARPPLSEEYLRDWFWISGLRGNFYGSTTSYVTPACKVLEEWSNKSDPEHDKPDSIANFNEQSVKALDLQAPKARANDIIGKTVLAMIAASGSLDWQASGSPLISVVASKNQSVQAHHIIPEDLLASRRFFNCSKDNDRLKPIANFAPISQHANGSLSSSGPLDVKLELGNRYTSILESSAVPPAEFERVTNLKSFQKFIEVREEAIKKLIIGFLNL